MTKERAVAGPMDDRNDIRALVLRRLADLVARAESLDVKDLVAEKRAPLGRRLRGDRGAAGLEPWELWQGGWTVWRSRVPAGCDDALLVAAHARACVAAGHGFDQRAALPVADAVVDVGVWSDICMFIHGLFPGGATHEFHGRDTHIAALAQIGVRRQYAIGVRTGRGCRVKLLEIGTHDFATDRCVAHDFRRLTSAVGTFSWGT